MPLTSLADSGSLVGGPRAPQVERGMQLEDLDPLPPCCSRQSCAQRDRIRGVFCNHGRERCEPSCALRTSGIAQAWSTQSVLRGRSLSAALGGASTCRLGAWAWRPCGVCGLQRKPIATVGSQLGDGTTQHAEPPLAQTYLLEQRVTSLPSAALLDACDDAASAGLHLRELVVGGPQLLVLMRQCLETPAGSPSTRMKAQSQAEWSVH